MTTESNMVTGQKGDNVDTKGKVRQALVNTGDIEAVIATLGNIEKPKPGEDAQHLKKIFDLRMR